MRISKKKGNTTISFPECVKGRKRKGLYPEKGGEGYFFTLLLRVCGQGKMGPFFPFHKRRVGGMGAEWTGTSFHHHRGRRGDLFFVHKLRNLLKKSKKEEHSLHTRALRSR